MIANNEEDNNLIDICVIIPAYNCERYLLDTIKSVRQQSNNIDIVVVNDGSTDGTRELCDSLELLHKNIKVIHKKNGGVSSARNIGIAYAIEHMPYSYIAFLDADDAWDKKFYTEEVREILKKNYDLIGFQSCVCDEKMRFRNNPTQMVEGYYDGGVKSVWIHSSQTFCAMLYRCEFLKRYNIRFDEKIHYSEDKIFSMQALYLADSILLKNKLMYLYRNNTASAMYSRQYGIKYFLPIIDAYIESDKLMEKYNNEKRLKLQEGTVLANIYIMDMVDEHLQCFGSRKAIEAVLREKKYYIDIISGELKEQECIHANERYLKYKKNPLQYCIINNMKGIVGIIKRSISNIPMVRKIVNQCRFSITI